MVLFNEDKQNKRLTAILIEEEENLVQILAETKYNLPYINLKGVSVENAALQYVGEEEARKLSIGPFNIQAKKLMIAVRFPNRPGIQAVDQRLRDRGLLVEWYMASELSLNKIWKRYEELSQAKRVKAGSLNISNELLEKISEKIKRLEDVREFIEKSGTTSRVHRITKILEVIFGGAIALNCSDVHIEPEEDNVRMRFRLDGILHDIFTFDKSTYNLINSRIKLLSGLKLSHNKNQDGRFGIDYKDLEISIRTSIIPGTWGEGIVMRILNPLSIGVEMEQLGIEKKLFDIINREIEKPNGLILITGPTGSGKTTTLYAFLKRIYSTEIKVITIEDPVEYHLAGITQTQTNDEKGYTFLEGLRSAMRQDPDIVMVGEIRDGETAGIAVQASLTGHMVFSTLHTNNAAGVVPRLIDLKVNPKILVSALSLSIAQRLVRKLCTQCKKKREVTKEDETIIKKILTTAKNNKKDLESYDVSPEKPIVLWEPQGCEDCNQTGYKGRIGIFEAILSDELLEEIIPNNPSERQIKEIGNKQGILSMKEDGIIKALNGVTSLEEVKKVVDIYEE
jgi:type IV pilus assembly protein PilB